MSQFHSYASDAADPSIFRRRVGIAVILVFVCFLILFMRLTYLQLFKQHDYTAAAESNRTVSLPITASRGLVRDRNGEMMAQNYWAYSLDIDLNKIGNTTVSELIDELSTYVHISKADRRRFQRLREEIGRLESIPIRTRLSEAEVARFVANRWRFPGVNVSPKEFRYYPQRDTASHLVGYIGRISLREKNSIKEDGLENAYLGLGSIGKVGIERSYEHLLRGHPGEETLEVTAGGRPVRKLAMNEATSGKNIELSVDLNLQRIAEAAFDGDTGAAIAIDPKTGEILAFVSAPTYDPNHFPTGIDPDTWEELSQSEKKPLLNRAARGLYPIGSTYKPFMALAGLEYGVITPKTQINDTGEFLYFGHRFRDSTGVPKGMVDLRRSIAISSDVYYYWLASELGIDRIEPFMKQWGFGQLTGIDIVGEQRGNLPSPEWKKRRFNQRWFPGDTINIGIGQGYNQFTLLQLAHATATLANRGVVMQPHLVRRIIDPVTGNVEWPYATPVRTIPLKKRNVEAVIDGMVDVTTKGTARRVFEGVPYKVAGKTGTAQVVTIAQDKKYDAKKLAREHHDHALFIAFAPAKNPKIAVAVLKENGGFGAQAAAPIAKAMLDYWILGENTLNLPAPAHLRGAPMPSAEFPVPPKAIVSDKGGVR